MNFTIQENKHIEPPSKNSNYSFNCDVNVQRVLYNIKPVIEDRIQDFLTNQFSETHRQNELDRLMKTAVLQNQSQQLLQLICNLYQKHNPPPSKLYTLLKSLILSCNLPLPQLLSSLPQPSLQLQLAFYSILLYNSLFSPSNTLLLGSLQPGFFSIRENSTAGTNEILQEIVRRQPSGVNLLAGLRSLKRLKINTQEFRKFVLELWEKALKGREVELVGMFQRYLGEVADGKSNQTHVEYLFLVMDSLSALYFKTIKGKLDRFMTSGEYPNIISLNQNLSSTLIHKGYFQLLNLYQICLKQWLNTNNNYLQLAIRTFPSQPTRASVINSFLPLLQNFKEAQKLYLRLFIKNPSISAQQYLPLFSSILGANYSSHISQLVKDLAANTINVQNSGRVTVRVVNKTLYPKEWPENPLEKVMKDSKVIKAVEQYYPEVIKTLKQLMQVEEDWNKKDRLRGCKVVHHRITTTDGAVYSLQQFIVLIQKKQVVTIDPSIKSSDFQAANPPSYDSYYPTLIQKQQTKQPQEVPQYIIEANIMKHLKKVKTSTAEQISRVVGFKEELVRVLLGKLIEKEYAKKDGDAFVYVP